jgi:peptidoglycan/LPS O-acetylase OafA/YrhL
MLKGAFSLRRNLSLLLRRPDEHAQAVDGLRAIAVLVVLLSHLYFISQFYIPDAARQFARLPLWAAWPVQGYLGVDIFFVISGFLIGGMLFREFAARSSIDLGRFYMRRFLRLTPLYWLALALSALAASMEGDALLRVGDVQIPQNVDAVWQNLLYINNFFDPDRQFAAMTHSWSLAVEEQFYLLFPVLLLLFFRTRLHLHPVKVGASLVLAYLVIRAVARLHSIALFDSRCGMSREALAETTFDPLAILTSPQAHCIFNVEASVMFENLYTKYVPLLFGAWASYFCVCRGDAARHFYSRKWLVDIGVLASLAAIGFCFLAPFLIPQRSAFHPLFNTFLQQIVLGLAVANIIVASHFAVGPIATAVRRALSAGFLYPLAQLSYSIYLFNLLIVHLTYKALISRSPDIALTDLLLQALPVVLAATLISSMLAYLLIERPFMNLRDKNLRGKGEAAETNAAPLRPMEASKAQ